MPLCVGVPLIVTVLDAHDAVTPEGRPVAEPIPVAPVVACVISVSAVLMHSVGAEDPADTVFSFTTMVPVAAAGPQPPVRGIL